MPIKTNIAVLKIILKALTFDEMLKKVISIFVYFKSIMIKLDLESNLIIMNKKHLS